MDILALIDRLEDIVDGGRGIWLTHRKLVDPEAVFEIVDEIRERFPDELKQARHIVKQRQEMLEDAEKEANRVLEDARMRAEALADEQEIVRLARQQSAEILDRARLDEREMRLGAEDYADEILANLEVQLGKQLTGIQRARERLQGKSTQTH